MLSVADRAIIKEAAKIDPRFAQKYGLVSKHGLPLGSAFVEQNNIPVTSVQPGTPIQLYANNYPAGFFSDTFFLVMDAAGNVILPKTEVSVNLMGNAWYDWTAPTVEGTYTFYANSDDRANNFAVFTVSHNAPPPGEQKPKSTNWLLIGGVFLVVTAGFVVWAMRK